MALDSPLIHDGSQCTAAANLGLNAGLAGPNGSGQFLVVKITGSRQVNVSSTAGGAGYGILQNTPPAGQAADVGIMGISKAVAGGAFSAGATLAVGTGGTVVTGGSGATVVALALEAATASGQIVSVAIVPGMATT